MLNNSTKEAVIMKVIIILLIGLISAIGWIMNIVKIISCDWVISGEEVLRVIGVFVAPLGAVLGFIGHF